MNPTRSGAACAEIAPAVAFRALARAMQSPGEPRSRTGEPARARLKGGVMSKFAVMGFPDETKACHGVGVVQVDGVRR